MEEGWRRGQENVWLLTDVDSSDCGTAGGLARRLLRPIIEDLLPGDVDLKNDICDGATLIRERYLL